MVEGVFSVSVENCSGSKSDKMVKYMTRLRYGPESTLYSGVWPCNVRQKWHWHGPSGATPSYIRSEARSSWAQVAWLMDKVLHKEGRPLTSSASALERTLAA